jgi:hypothetical protein
MDHTAICLVHFITKESSTATHPKDFCEKNPSKLPDLEIFVFEITIFRQ